MSMSRRIGQRAQPVGPGQRVHRPPDTKAGLRRSNGKIDILGPGLGNTRQRDAARRIDTGTLLTVAPDTLPPAPLERMPPDPRAPWQPAGGGSGGTEAHSLAAPAVLDRIAAGIALVRNMTPVTLTRLPLSLPGALLPFRHPLDHIGRYGDEGLASGPGIAIGAALALKGSGRLPVAVLGDGDFMMGATALWTAGNMGLPLLVVVYANGVYGNDVVH